MKRIEAEKLLGGYATGTLTEDERQTLFAAALAHQEVFNALADEEALRELLADPAARAQLLAALGSGSAPKVVPFWRRPVLLGAAASLMVAATAGLAYLRSPEASMPAVKRDPPVLKEEAPAARSDAPAPKSLSMPLAAELPAAKEAKAEAPRRTRTRETSSPQLVPEPSPPPPSPEALPVAKPVAVHAAITLDAVRLKALGKSRRAEAQDKLEKKTEAARPAPAASPAPATAAATAAVAPAATAAVAPAGAAVVEVLASVAPATSTQTAPTQTAPTQTAPTQTASASGNLASGAPLPAARKANGGLAPARTGRLDDHTWTLAPQPDGTTRVTVSGPPGAHVEVLKRTGDEVTVLRPQGREPVGNLVQWRYQVRLAEGDALDVYLLPVAVPDPAHLPEVAPVNGYRMRIHPAAEKK